MACDEGDEGGSVIESVLPVVASGKTVTAEEGEERGCNGDVCVWGGWCSVLEEWEELE